MPGGTRSAMMATSLALWRQRQLPSSISAHTSSGRSRDA
jgi:hypothetical protein